MVFEIENQCRVTNTLVCLRLFTDEQPAVWIICSDRNSMVCSFSVKLLYVVG